jgi:hypothetical protein
MMIVSRAAMIPPSRKVVEEGTVNDGRSHFRTSTTIGDGSVESHGHQLAIVVGMPRHPIGRPPSGNRPTVSPRWRRVDGRSDRRPRRDRSRRGRQRRRVSAATYSSFAAVRPLPTFARTYSSHEAATRQPNQALGRIEVARAVRRRQPTVLGYQARSATQWMRSKAFPASARRVACQSR